MASGRSSKSMTGNLETRRATSPAWNPAQRHDSRGSAGRRKLSADSAGRNLFPKASRTSHDDLLPAENWSSTKVDQPVKVMTAERGALGQKPVTIMSVFRLNVEKYPERQAYAYRVDDAWEYITYHDFFEQVKRAAKGFISLGLERFSGVAIFGYNSHEWVVTNFAAIYAGGIVVPIPRIASTEDLHNIIVDTRSNIVVVGTSRQLNLVGQIRNQLPLVKAVIKYGKDDIVETVSFHTWEKLFVMGDTLDDERLKERIAFQAPNLCCTILHTPGTTGPPKPVMLSQDNLVWTARMVGRRMSCSVASGAIMGLMPFSHIVGLLFHVYLPLLFASTCYPISTMEDFIRWTRDVQPTILYAPLPVVEEVRVKLKAQLTRSCIGRIITWWAQSIGLRGYRARTTRRLMPFGWSLASALVFKKIRTALGLQNCHEIIIAGHKVSLETLEFFASLDIPVLECYGLTETSGPHSASTIPDKFLITSVGKEMEGCATKIMQPDKNGLGEARIRGRHVFMGYLNQPELTEESIDKEGWFKTGDLVRRDENGFLFIPGKLAELVILKTGETIPPEPFETRVKEELPFVRNCMLVGSGKTYLAILLTIKTEVNWETYEVSNVLSPHSRHWFRNLGYEDETIDQFIQNPSKKILDKIQTHIDRLNARIEQPSHRIHKWTVLPKDFSVPAGELTWTLKVRRYYIEKMYAETIDSLYVEK